MKYPDFLFRLLDQNKSIERDLLKYILYEKFFQEEYYRSDKKRP